MINLLPPDMKKNIKYARLNVEMVNYIVIVVLVTVSILLVMVFTNFQLLNNKDQLNATIEENEKSLSELEPYHSQAKALQDQLSVLSQVFDREIKFSELIVEIGSLMPQGAVLNNLSLSDDKETLLTLNARVNNLDKAAVLRKNLEESDLFFKADITSATGDTDAADGYSGTVVIIAEFDTTQDQSPKKEVENDNEAE